MTLDHLSFCTHDLTARRHFYERQICVAVIIHDQLHMAEACPC
jgi:hypothetical protein